MYIWFFVCVLGLITILPLYFLSVEHLKLQNRYGEEKGIKISKIFGVISGWGFFLFWFGIWISPQARFTVPILSNLSISIPFVDFSIPALHLIIFAPFFIWGIWYGIKGVEETTLQTAETHRPDKIITTGIYSTVRHPQYFGGLLAHVGISFLFSALFSLVSTALILLIIYIISWKEEKELIREFGNEYEVYKKRVPMLIPRFINRKTGARELSTSLA